MPDVVVDGVRYMPSRSIGIAVTTQNRTEVFQKSLAEMRKHSPGLPIVVVDDGSSTPVPDADFRFDKPQGIAVAKNKCLELLDDLGVDHFFLWDDDAYPLVDGWWLPYVESPEPHLMRIFEDVQGPRKLKDITRIGGDDKHDAWTGARGVMMYVHRSVLDRVGGFDPIYGRWGFEHPDYSRRIFNAGLTSWCYADVKGSDKLIYCLDEFEAVKRTVPDAERQTLAEKNAVLCNERYAARFAGYVPFRERRNYVVTNYLTAVPDPQRGTRLQANTAPLKAWAGSIKGATPVVLHDALPDGSALFGAEFVKVPALKHNPYFLRWQHARRWLLDTPDAGFVFVTDGTDVVMQREPWEAMEPGKLYVGSEPSIVDNDWLKKNHPSWRVQDFIVANPHLTLLNAGVCGGDRETVIGFLSDLLKEWQDTLTDVFHKVEQPVGVGDMGLFNAVAYSERWRDRLVYGPRVTTVFKANETNGWSWFRHK